ncbi:MAG: ATP-binding protein [Actinomycetota bacterium]
MDPPGPQSFNGCVNGTTEALEQTQMLLELGREVSGSLELDGVLNRSLAALRRIIRFGGGSIQMVRDDALMLVAGDPEPTPDAYRTRIPIGQGVGGRIVADGEPIYVPDIWTDPRTPPPAERALSDGVRSYFGVPLIAGGAPIGVLQLDSPDPDGFPAEARALVLSFAPTIAAAVQNAELYARELDTIEKLRAAERLRSDFLAMISHELRTPLTTLSGFAELLTHRAESLQPALVEEFGRRMWRASRWLSRMIGDLLDLAQMERGDLALEITATDVVAAIDDATSVEVREPRTIRSHVEEDLPDALADPMRLRQILGNLLSNARKFSPPGSTIDVRCRRDGDRIAISVADEGRGIPQDELGRIFDAFVQVDPGTTREAGGMGTGLYLTKQLCQRMGAEVSVESAPGAGSRFTIRLRTADRRQWSIR